ncbi:hypothetical protein [Vibrio mexicanus]|uniref:hypothetical protein n=1 Tax=Vibrio mexicanus TaxID=1004326 RepID=UPI00063C8BC0|nr:hypothetical protein [Vibrio mexicanus]
MLPQVTQPYRLTLLVIIAAICGCTNHKLEQEQCYQQARMNAQQPERVTIGIGVNSDLTQARHQSLEDLVFQLTTDVTSESKITYISGLEDQQDLTLQSTAYIKQSVGEVTYQTIECQHHLYAVVATRDDRPIHYRNSLFTQGSAWTNRINLAQNHNNTRLTAYIPTTKHLQPLIGRDLFYLLSRPSRATLNGEVELFIHYESPITLHLTASTEANYISVISYNSAGELKHYRINQPNNAQPYILQDVFQPYEPVESLQFLFVEHENPLQLSHNDDLTPQQKQHQFLNLYHQIKQHHWRVSTALYSPSR